MSKLQVACHYGANQSISLELQESQACVRLPCYYQEARHFYTDGRAHPKQEDRWLTTWGDSVGHWQGDTLLIDTVSVREPLRFFQRTPPFSDDAHYVERLHMTAPDRIESEFTVEDPLTLTKPWTVKLAYRRTANLDRLMHDAFGNDRSELEGDSFIIAPPRDEGAGSVPQ